MKAPTTPVRPRVSRSPFHEPTIPMAAALEGSKGTPHLILSYRWFWYLLSFFVPFSGMLIALLLFEQDSREIRSVGRNCLLISFVVWVMFPLIVLATLLLVGVLALADWFTDIFSPAD